MADMQRFIRFEIIASDRKSLEQAVAALLQDCRTIDFPEGSGGWSGVVSTAVVEALYLDELDVSTLTLEEVGP